MATTTKPLKPGQKYKTPAQNDSLCKFYTSLYKQNKKSTMAMKWCLEHGLFKEKKAAEIEIILKMEKLALKK
jgi:hypothetical protein